MVLDPSSLVAPADASDDVAHPATERNVLGDDVLTEGGTSSWAKSQIWSCWSGVVEKWSVTRSTNREGGGVTSPCLRNSPFRAQRSWSPTSPKSL